MSCRGFEPVCTNNELREYFSNKGLTYDSIDEGDILILCMMLQKELKKSNKVGETSVSTMTLSKRVNLKKKSNGHISECFIYMNSHYFTQRECISFNRDGWIGFAGWADDGNTNPLRRAFLAWCDYLAEGGEADGKG